MRCPGCKSPDVRRLWWLWPRAVYRCRDCGREWEARTWLSPAFAALLLALASPLAAQDPGPVEQSPDVLAEGEPTRLTDYLYAAGWCPAHSGPDDPAFGCDGGLAVDLYSRPIGERYGAGLVAFVGAETVGAGVAWCRRGARLCVGVGVAAARDDFGIRTDTLAPVIGATFSLSGLRE